MTGGTRNSTKEHIILWSYFYFIDTSTFAIFENGHYAADQVYFYDSSSQKSANFQKITGTLKIIFGVKIV